MLSRAKRCYGESVSRSVYIASDQIIPIRPVKRELKELKGSDKLPREEKVRVLTRCLTAVGRRIEESSRDATGSDREKQRQEKHLWKIASGFWPIEDVDYRQVQGMCEHLFLMRISFRLRCDAILRREDDGKGRSYREGQSGCPEEGQARKPHLEYAAAYCNIASLGHSRLYVRFVRVLVLTMGK